MTRVEVRPEEYVDASMLDATEAREVAMLYHRKARLVDAMGATWSRLAALAERSGSVFVDGPPSGEFFLEPSFSEWVEEHRKLVALVCQLERAELGAPADG